MSSRNLGVELVFSGRKDRSLGRATRSAADDNQKLGKSVKSVQRRLGDKRAGSRYGRMMDGLRRKSGKLGMESNQLSSYMSKVARGYSRASREARTYSRNTDMATRSSRSLGQSMFGGITRGDVARAGALAGAAALTMSTRASMLEETEKRYLATVINAADGDRLAAAERSRLSARAYSRRRDTTVGTGELLKIEYDMNSAGLSEDAARFGARISHDVARVTRGVGEDVAKTIGSTYNIIGEKLAGDTDQKMTRIGNVLTATQLKYQFSNFSDLQSGFEKALPRAASMDVSLEQTAAIIGTLNQNAVSRERAGTAFIAVARSLYKASEEYGFEMARSETGELDMLETISRLRDSVGDLDDQTQAKLLTTFGDEGMVGLLPLLKDIDQVKVALGEIDKDVRDGILRERLQILDDDEAAKVEKLRIAIAELAKGVGRGAAPAVGALSDLAARAINGVGTIIDTVPGAQTAIGGLIGAGTVLVGVLFSLAAGQWAWNAAMNQSMASGLWGRMKGIAPKMMGLGKTLPRVAKGARAVGVSMMFASSAGATMAGVGAVLLGPVGIGLAVFAGAGLLIYKYWKPIKAFFGGLWSVIGPPLEGTLDTFEAFAKLPGVSWIFAPFRWAGTAIKKVGEFLKPVETGLEGAESAGQRVGHALVYAFNNNAVVKGVRGAIGLFKTLHDFVAKIVGKLAEFKDFITFAGSIAQSPGTAVKVAGSAVRAKAKTGMRGVPIGMLGMNPVGMSAVARAMFQANDNSPSAANDSANDIAGFTSPEAYVARSARGGSSAAPVTQTFPAPTLNFYGVTDRDSFVREVMPVMDEMVAAQKRAAQFDVE